MKRSHRHSWQNNRMQPIHRRDAHLDEFLTATSEHPLTTSPQVR